MEAAGAALEWLRARGVLALPGGLGSGGEADGDGDGDGDGVLRGAAFAVGVGLERLPASEWVGVRLTTDRAEAVRVAREVGTEAFEVDLVVRGARQLRERASWAEEARLLRERAGEAIDAALGRAGVGPAVILQSEVRAIAAAMRAGAVEEALVRVDGLTRQVGRLAALSKGAGGGAPLGDQEERALRILRVVLAGGAR